ncbi:MAG: GTP cyclohydrolase II, partial [Amylibacter sp.]|nr:GTP cyclohydrolase II [Amylibacter sp.]
MSIALTASERIARIRSDFRMGVAVAFRSGLEKWLVASSETITLSRFNGMRKLGPLELAITDWRAQTLSTWATDGDIARLAIPDDKDLDWVHSVCDPSDDFNTPLKGPFTPIFGGSADVSRTALAICKTAHLIPSAVSVNVTD